MVVVHERARPSWQHDGCANNQSLDLSKASIRFQTCACCCQCRPLPYLRMHQDQQQRCRHVQEDEVPAGLVLTCACCVLCVSLCVSLCVCVLVWSLHGRPARASSKTAGPGLTSRRMGAPILWPCLPNATLSSRTWNAGRGLPRTSAKGRSRSECRRCGDACLAVLPWSQERKRPSLEDNPFPEAQQTSWHCDCKVPLLS